MAGKTAYSPEARAREIAKDRKIGSEIKKGSMLLGLVPVMPLICLEII